MDVNYNKENNEKVSKQLLIKPSGMIGLYF